MKPIIFFDTEVDPSSGKVLDIGACQESGREFHSRDESAFMDFIRGTEFLVGHNAIRHDLQYISKEIHSAAPQAHVIDTLDLAPLLFPKIPYHSLVKDDKLNTEELNNPLNDSKKARDLFYDEVNAFNALETEFQRILYSLLKDNPHFSGFFAYLNWNIAPSSTIDSIYSLFHEQICAHADLGRLITTYPAALAYCLALIRVKDQYSIVPRWLQYARPEIQQVMYLLRSKPCISGCPYCDQFNDAHAGLKSIFGFDAFRKFGGEDLQENAVKAALKYESLLAVFPTGGGKSITFQLPALMQGQQNKGLTVIISPLQSLMKDQVDNLEKSGITSAVTINGQLDPIERSKSFERVEEGTAHLLYISPESLRSPYMEKLILSRSINRFVIDEAHCFSSWGQDFRVDYLYIGEFIRNIQAKRNQDSIIPVSCFTATAKPQVIEDIRQYFLDKLDLNLTVFQSTESRKNLHYTVYEQTDDTAKYNTLRDILTQYRVPTIVYVSRTKRAENLADKLSNDGLPARPYHGKLDSKIKMQNQDAFLAGDVGIMVATTAFGMGVDKKDIQSVVHYEISDSLENYVQEAGRAGRDEKLNANCFILFNEDDLDKHFILQNNTRLTQKEINQVWKAIKYLTKFRETISQSALQIARKAGWDESVKDIGTRVTTAIAALEQAGYIKRKNNQSRVYADSLQYKTAQAAIDRIEASDAMSPQDKIQATRIVKSLISSKRKADARDEEGEARVDYLSERLGIPLEEVVRIISLLVQEKLLSEARDLNAFISKSNPEAKMLKVIRNYHTILMHLLEQLDAGMVIIRLKEFRDQLEKHKNLDTSVKDIRNAIQFLSIKNWIVLKYRDREKNTVEIILQHGSKDLQEKTGRLLALAPLISSLLIDLAKKEPTETDPVLVDFSVGQIHEALVNSGDLQFQKVSRSEIEDTLFYLSKTDALTIEGGFLVIYQRLMVERIKHNTSLQYKNIDYEALDRFYKNKIQQVHIVGEYARRMIKDYQGALQFVDDYFNLQYDSFIRKYFPGRQDEISRTITRRKFDELFGTLSPQQLSIVKDTSNYIAVLAGPGSGKTRVLVHKLAASSLLENLKHEQILMLTFSRSAVTEFKSRLYKLIGNAAAFIEIKTFHSYCFDLLGRMGDLQHAGEVVRTAVTAIQEERIEPNRIAKLLLLVDEAQDMDEDEYELIRTLIKQNTDMRLIMVGDDDQNIFEFRNSGAAYLKRFYSHTGTSRYELLENYRSKIKLVAFTNRYADTIQERLKTMPIESRAHDDGEISIISYTDRYLSVPVSDLVEGAELKGSTAILCQTNQEASEIHGLLVKKGVAARLIQSTEGFNLMNLTEIRVFVDRICKKCEFKITPEVWEEEKQSCKQVLRQSRWWPMLLRLWKDFEIANPKAMYVSDLLDFVSESKMEDFLYAQADGVIISTYHKAKGKEFDQVYLTVAKPPQKNDHKRALYVAMTRAKDRLIILTHGHFLKPIAEDVLYTEDNNMYSRPDELAYMLQHDDVYLSHFASQQAHIEMLIAGDPLQVNEDGCKDMAGHFVARFSKKFLEHIQTQKKAGYRIQPMGMVNMIVYWKVDEGKEVRVVLPEVVFLNH
jgi:ATP-dependent DNA helicase RecQ